MTTDAPGPTGRLRVAATRFAARLTVGGPPLAWTLRGYQRSSLRGDVIGGVTVAALIVPLSIGYAQVAGLPPEAGLYASMLPLVAYAVFGSARRLIVGPDAATAALVAAAILPLAVGSDDRLRLASALALLVAALFIAMRLASLGFLADLLSRPILVGYMSGVGITVALGQIPKILGGKPLSGVLSVLGGVDLRSADIGVVLGALGVAIRQADVNGPSIVVGGIVLVAVFAGDRLLPGVPVALIAMIGALVASVVLDLPARGVQVLGPVPSGLPPVALPLVSVDEAFALLPGALGIAILSFADATLTGRRFAERSGELTDPDRELLALGAADLGASLTTGYPISSSASRTAALESSGATTQLAGIVAAGAVALVLVFLAGYLTNLPIPAIGAVILISALRFIDLRGIATIWRTATVEGVIAVTALAGVLLYGTLYGVAIATLLATINVFRRAAQPQISELGRLPSGSYADLDRDPSAVRTPGVLVVRYAGPLFFATATSFRTWIRTALDSRPDVRHVVVDASAIVDLDLTAADGLRSVTRDLQARDVTFELARPRGGLRDLLRRFGLASLAGLREDFERDIDLVVNAAASEPGEPEPAADGSTARPSPIEATTEASGPTGPVRHWSAGVLVLAVVAVGAVLVAALAGGSSREPPSGLVAVPNIVGQSLERATKSVENAGLVMGDATYVQTSSLPEGTVTEQDPAAGTNLGAGSPVDPTVSTGAALVTVPDVVGMPASEAVVTLTSAGLHVGTMDEAPDPAVAAGIVLTTDPGAGRQVARLTTVDLVVSSGPTAASVAWPTAGVGASVRQRQTSREGS